MAGRGTTACLWDSTASTAQGVRELKSQSPRCPWQSCRTPTVRSLQRDSEFWHKSGTSSGLWALSRARTPQRGASAFPGWLRITGHISLNFSGMGTSLAWVPQTGKRKTRGQGPWHPTAGLQRVKPHVIRLPKENPITCCPWEKFARNAFEPKLMGK